MLGPVFRGYDPEQDRVVAIKAFFLDLTPEQAPTLAAELDRLSSLVDSRTPSSSRRSPAGTRAPSVYLVQEYFVAESADVALKQYGPAPVPDALRLIGQLAGALDAAAAAGVHHGALHPRDVLVAPHEVRLTGLGVVPGPRARGVPAAAAPALRRARADDGPAGDARVGRLLAGVSRVRVAHRPPPGAVGRRRDGRHVGDPGRRTPIGARPRCSRAC